MSTPGTVYTDVFSHSLDDKNRLTIPAGWRDAQPEGPAFIAVPQTDRNGNNFIAVFPPEKVAAMRAQALQIPISQIDKRQAMARFFAKSKSFNFDKQGRVPLTAELLAHAAITKEAVLVGALDNFFIYNPETWALVEAKSVADDNATLAELGI